MRSVYQPTSFSIPRPLTVVAPFSFPLGGDCAETIVSPFKSPTAVHEKPIDALLTPLVERASQKGSCLFYSPVGGFHHGDCRYRLPRFVFHGPPGGGSLIRLGIFAAIHGDEPEGAVALRDFLLQLDAEPAFAQGYEIYAYPVCNPSGFEDGTQHSRSGCDLNREFWHGSKEPEVYFLERELGVHQFAGLVTLHSDPAASGAYAFVRGATLMEALAQPVLAAAAPFLPLASSETTKGHPAQGGLNSPCNEGVMSNPVELKPAPFEIVFGTSRLQPATQQIAATVAALGVILREYRQFLAYGENL